MAVFAPILAAGLGWLGRFMAMGLVTALGFMFSDVLLSLISQALNLLANGVVAAGLELPEAPDWGVLPIEFLQDAKRVGIDTALTIVLAAVSVKWAGKAFKMVRGLRRGATP